MIDYWNGVHGQEVVKNLFNHLIHSSKIPHAFLFNGISGIGKDLVAVRLAQALILSSDSSNKEYISGQVANLSEPYLKYIIPLPRGKNETDESGPLDKLSQDDIQVLKEELSRKIKNPYHKISIAKANQIKISSIRDIKKFLSFSYDDIRYRVILISDAHMMNEEAQNALLKNIEEPPAGVIFILTTPYPGLLRETIRSRCWMINFQPLPNEEIKRILIEHFEIDEQEASLVTPFASGSVTSALNLLDHDINSIMEKTILILRYSLGRKYHSALNEILPLVNDGGNESLKLLIQMIVVWLNDVQKYRYSSGDYYFKSHLETIEKFNKRFSDVKLNEIVYNLDRISSLLQNNINLNLAALNVIHELSVLTSKPFK